jgi:hypothetical protein
MCVVVQEGIVRSVISHAEMCDYKCDIPKGIGKHGIRLNEYSFPLSWWRVT